jgi:hypothetical protein
MKIEMLKLRGGWGCSFISDCVVFNMKLTKALFRVEKFGENRKM